MKQLMICASLLLAFSVAYGNPSCSIWASNNEPEVEAEFQKQFKAQQDADRITLQRMSREPAKFYLELRSKARAELKNSKSDFHFAPYRPIVERIALDLKQRQTRKFGNKYYTQLENLHQEASALLQDGDPPYRQTVRFILHKYLPMLDQILGERHPELLGNEFHKRNAEHLLEEFLDHAPNLLLHFSFASRGNQFFIDSRSSLFQFIGISLKGLDDQPQTPFGDNFKMKNSEFSWHDVGHVDFMAYRDLKYILSSQKPIERIVEEWDVTRTRTTSILDQTSDRDLADAMEYVLMELLHERGFQYSLTVLKTELETAKWTDVIQRKRAAGFYSHFSHNQNMFARLEDARNALLQVVLANRAQDQVRWYHAVRADRVSSKFTYTPRLIYESGQLERIELDKSLRAQLFVRTGDGRVESTSIREMISAQVNPTKNSPLTTQTISQIEMLLNANELPGYGEVQSILIAPTHEISVRFKSEKILPLEKAMALLPTQQPTRRIENLEIFKIDQALGSFERNEKVSFTIRAPPRILVGKGELDDKSNLHIQTNEGEALTLPLSEIRIDPLHSLDLED